MTVVDDGTETTQRRRRKLFHLCASLRLNRDERLDLASMVLYQDINSYNELDDQQVCRLLDSLEGFLLVKVLLDQRG